MFDYMNVKEAAEKWGLSERRIQVLCATNRIPDVMRNQQCVADSKDCIKAKRWAF